MSAAPPGPIEAHPRISDWIAFPEPGRARVRSGRVELGQGNATALTQIAADELDLGLDQVTLVAGDTAETPDEAFTSGSRSIEVGGGSIRLAASAARAVLLAEAATLLQADPADLSVERGVIHRGGEATPLDYWTLAGTVDLDRPVADHAAPKPAAARRLAGAPVPRLDLPWKVAGGGFVHDLSLPGMLHGRVVHPPRLAARLVSVDTQGLEERHGPVTLVRDGSFLGVLADREASAVAAAAELERRCVWTEGGAGPADPVAALRRALGSDGDDPVETMADRGRVEEAPGQRFETTVSRPYVAHASIGPSAAVARIDGGDVTLWSHSQGVFPLRAAVSTALGLDPGRVRVIHLQGAGCYGHNGADDAAFEAVLLARAVPGRPVRLVWSRADELATSPLGTAQVTRAAAAVADGRITGLSVEIASQPFVNRPGRHGRPNLLSGMLLDPPQPSLAGTDIPDGADRNADPYYAIPAVRVRKRIVRALPYRTSSLRGLGAFVNVFAIETLIDDIAHALGRDAVALRLDHLDDDRARAVVSRAAALAGWPGDNGAGKGLGIGFARYKNVAGYCAVAAEVEAEAEVRVRRLWAVADCGEAVNPDGVANQIEGGMIQAASWTLKEAVRLEGETVASRDWASYPILTFSETPETAVEVIARPDLPPLGAGEASMGPTAAAIGNALRNALGVRVRDLPLTRERVAAALG